MGFLDNPAPNPRTVQYYEYNRQNAYRLYCEAVELGYDDATIAMCLELVEYWNKKAESLNA